MKKRFSARESVVLGWLWLCADIYMHKPKRSLPLFAGWQHVALWQWETLWAPRYAVCSLSSGCLESLASSGEPTAPTPSWTAPASAGQSADTRNRAQPVTSTVLCFATMARVWHREGERNLFLQRRELLGTAFALFSSMRFSLIKNAFGTDSPAFIIYYT